MTAEYHLSPDFDRLCEENRSQIADTEPPSEAADTEPPSGIYVRTERPGDRALTIPPPPFDATGWRIE